MIARLHTAKNDLVGSVRLGSDRPDAILLDSRVYLPRGSRTSDDEQRYVEADFVLTLLPKDFTL